ncbi:hypothetical protein PHLCEN_2v2951 [Hermanssonia centrifuga]|uniref:Uncharacterized protein n=1 Tax=Hermanssonia centrifuga TaxID=98765 RepID=A0A2R6RHP5_9APHY|nr:hypothetical protein PHLCEN_2v2951 [Hermanssonia centrifuga]
MIPYCRRYRQALADAFDVYLQIIQLVDKRILSALGHDSENWCVLNACPPCGYELDNEPPLVFSRMYAMDGNNSLKCIAKIGDRKAGDTRIFQDSNY